jgi:hypothetical protein
MLFYLWSNRVDFDWLANSNYLSDLFDFGFVLMPQASASIFLSAFPHHHPPHPVLEFLQSGV